MATVFPKTHLYLIISQVNYMVDVVSGLLVVKLSVAVDCSAHFKIINNKIKITEIMRRRRFFYVCVMINLVALCRG